MAIRQGDSSIYCYSTLDYALAFKLGSFSVLPARLQFSPDSCLLAVLMKCVWLNRIRDSNGSVFVYNMLTLRHEVWTMPSDSPIIDYGFSGDSQTLWLMCQLQPNVVLYSLQLSHQLNCFCAALWRI